MKNLLEPVILSPDTVHRDEESLSLVFNVMQGCFAQFTLSAECKGFFASLRMTASEGLRMTASEGLRMTSKWAQHDMLSLFTALANTKGR